MDHRDPPATRPLTASEQAHVEDVLTELRQHFFEWPGYEGREHHLVGFALYEVGGSDHCREVIARAAPLALGKELVNVAGFSWAKLERAGSDAHYGVTHPDLPAPIDLESLERDVADRFEYTGPPEPGEVTNDAIRFILFLVAWHQVFGTETEVPNGPVHQLEPEFRGRGASPPPWYPALARQYI